MIKKILFSTSLFILLSFTNVSAETGLPKEYHINLDAKTIEKGYTVSAFEDEIKLSLVPGILSSSTAVDVLDLSEEPIPSPWQLDRISNIYQFEFRNKASYDDHKPFYIQFSYSEESDFHKQVFFFDKNFGIWRPLPTRDFPKEKFVRSLIHLPFARIAVFSYPDVLTVGKASWYKYKGGDFAASPDYPKGSRVRVRNADNDKFVDVVINDFGPDRGLFPDRAIDLDKVAFAKLASPGAGIINVEIEPLSIVPVNGRELDIPRVGASVLLESDVKSAIVIDALTGEMIWGKDSTSTLPLASLTKLVAAKVFLDTKPDMDKEVTYYEKDEEYNYEHVDHKWEVARLRVNEGDTMKISDLFYSGLVGSANNAIESLVRVSGLERDEFISTMNEMVKEWGASSTYFIEPTGLAPENMSTVHDFAIISRETLKESLIEKATKMREYKFYTINTEEFHRIRTTNDLIRSNKYNITGSKTGYLHEAGYCLMNRVSHDNKTVIVVTFGAESKTESFYENEKLIKFGLRNL